MYINAEDVARLGNANVLTNAALDKYARIPEYKVCAIKVEKLAE